MRSTTLSQIAAFAALYGSATIAMAQQPPPPVLPPCQQSSIQGNWGLMLMDPSLGPSACAITIAANGAVGTISCSNNGGEDYTFDTLPSGTLTVQSSCSVTGNISFAQGPSHSVGTYNLSPLALWLSADGSRLSGFSTGTVTYSNSSGQVWTQVELIYTGP